MGEKEKNKGKSAGYKWLTGIVATLFGVLLISGIFLLNENSAMAVEPDKETIKSANSPKADPVNARTLLEIERMEKRLSEKI